MKIENIKKEIIDSIKLFIDDKKGSEDKGAGVAIAMITTVALGFVIYNALTGFFTDKLFPSIFDKIMGILNIIP